MVGFNSFCWSQNKATKCYKDCAICTKENSSEIKPWVSDIDLNSQPVRTPWHLASLFIAHSDFRRVNRDIESGGLRDELVRNYFSDDTMSRLRVCHGTFREYLGMLLIWYLFFSFRSRAAALDNENFCLGNCCLLLDILCFRHIFMIMLHLNGSHVLRLLINKISCRLYD